MSRSSATLFGELVGGGCDEFGRVCFDGSEGVSGELPGDERSEAESRGASESSESRGVESSERVEGGLVGWGDLFWVEVVEYRTRGADYTFSFFFSLLFFSLAAFSRFFGLLRRTYLGWVDTCVSRRIWIWTLDVDVDIIDGVVYRAFGNPFFDGVI